MITIDPLDDDLTPGVKPALVRRTKTPRKEKSLPQADRPQMHKRGGLLGFLVRMLRWNSRES
jgi:hypothetical protein